MSELVRDYAVYCIAVTLIVLGITLTIDGALDIFNDWTKRR